MSAGPDDVEDENDLDERARWLRANTGYSKPADAAWESRDNGHSPDTHTLAIVRSGFSVGDERAAVPSPVPRGGTVIGPIVWTDALTFAPSEVDDPVPVVFDGDGPPLPVVRGDYLGLTDRIALIAVMTVSGGADS